MKILIHYAPFMPFDGNSGNVIHRRELAKNLSKLGNEVLVLAHFKDFQTASRLIKPIKSVEIKRAKIRFIGKILSKVFELFLVVLITFRWKPDLIYDGGLCSRLCALLLKIPNIKEVNGFVPDELALGSEGLLGTLRKYIFIQIDKNSAKHSAHIIVVTDNLKRVLQREYGINSNKITVIKNGVNIDLFRPINTQSARIKLGLSYDCNIICFVGGFAPWQGVEFLIQSAPLILKEIPHTKFLIIGEGQMEEELVELADETGVSDKFIFTGAVPYEEVPKYINASDVCAAPFIKERNVKIGLSPLKIYEYAACGKPVVSSRIPNLEFIEEQKAGILVEPENPEELAEAIIKLLKDEKLREEMGRNGREYAVKNHSWESVAKKVAEVCESAVRENKNKRE